jgi:DNA-directed RNA polymerase specialized sigma24 family protein
MSVFRNLSNKLFGHSQQSIRPIKDVLPNGTLTDDEVCNYLTVGSEAEQIRTVLWLYEVKFIGYLNKKFEDYPNLKFDIKAEYIASNAIVCVHIRTDVYKQKAALETYFYRIFHNSCVNFFRKKATNKSEEEAWYTKRAISIEEKCPDILINALEPNEVAELLDLFEKKEPSRAAWLKLTIDGFKDVDFVNLGMAKDADSFRSYLSQCRKAFEQFLNDNGYTYKRRKDKKDEPKPTELSIKTLFLLTFNVLRGLFDL